MSNDAPVRFDCLALSTPVRVGSDITGKWKSLGDCTAADMRAMSQDRQERAVELAVSAAKYERLARAMNEREVETVSGLDTSIVVTLPEPE